MRCGVHGGGVEGVPCGRRKPVSQSQIRQLFSWRHSRASRLLSSFGRDLRQQGPPERDSRVSGPFPSRAAEQGSVGEEASFPATSGPAPLRFSLFLVEGHTSVLSMSPGTIGKDLWCCPATPAIRVHSVRCLMELLGAGSGDRQPPCGAAPTAAGRAGGSRATRHECLVTTAQSPIHCHPAGSGEEAQGLWRPGCRG